MRGLICLTLLPLLASSAPTLLTDAIIDGAAPVITSSNAEQVPDSYIVVFKKHVSEAAAAHHHSWVQDIHTELQVQRTELRKRSGLTTDIFEGLKHTYKIGSDFLGYSGHFDDSIIDQVRRHPDVSSFRYSHSHPYLSTGSSYLFPFLPIESFLFIPSRHSAVLVGLG